MAARRAAAAVLPYLDRSCVRDPRTGPSARMSWGRRTAECLERAFHLREMPLPYDPLTPCYCPAYQPDFFLASCLPSPSSPAPCPRSADSPERLRCCLCGLPFAAAGRCRRDERLIAAARNRCADAHSRSRCMSRAFRSSRAAQPAKAAPPTRSTRRSTNRHILSVTNDVPFLSRVRAAAARRTSLAPTRLGAIAAAHLGHGRGRRLLIVPAAPLDL